MFKKINLLLFVLILTFAILPLVQSAPPFISASTSGCQIAPVIRETIKSGTDFDFNFHVFNLSNGVPLTNSTLSCYFHLYNQTGDHSFWIELNNDPISEHLVSNEWVARIGGGNFSTIGQYAYLVSCNGTMTGCTDKSAFMVTRSGLEATVGRGIIDVGLLFILVIFLIGFVVLFMETDNLLAKVGTLGGGYVLLIAITFIAWNMASDFLISAPFIVSMFRIMFFVLIIGAFPLLIGSFVWYFLMLWKVKEIQRLMGKGFSEDEARRRVK